MTEDNESPQGITHYFAELVGTDSVNDDSSSRREILKRCRPGEAIDFVVMDETTYGTSQVLARRYGSREIVGTVSAEAAQRIIASLASGRQVYGTYSGRGPTTPHPVTRQAPKLVVFDSPDGTTKDQVTQYFMSRYAEITGRLPTGKLGRLMGKGSQELEKERLSLESDHPTPADVGIESLYKFCAYTMGDSEQRSWIADMLRSNRIYFPKPSQFNDPWEARPAFSNEELDPEKMDRMRRAMVEIELIFSPGSSRARAKLETSRRLLDIERQKEISRGSLHDLLSFSRICSLSSRNDHPLLWAHYADGHKGLCVEFDTTMEPSSLARCVKYQDEYPVFDLMPDPATITRVMLTKANFWNYESEYRICFHDEFAQFQPVEFENGFVGYPSEALRSIYCGCLMGHGDIAAIRSMVEAKNKTVKFYIARLSDTEYSISFEKLP